MGVVSIRETFDALRAAGFAPIQAVIMTAIAKAESGLNTSTVGDNGQSYGLFQIYQPVWGDKFPPSCATDLYCSASAAYQISNNGTNFNPWTVYRVVHDPAFAAAHPEVAANKYTNFLPSIAAQLGFDIDDFGNAIPIGFMDLAKCLVNPATAPVCIAEKLGIDAGKITIDIIRKCGTDASCYLSETADAVTPDIPGIGDVFGLLPSLDSVKQAIVVLLLLGLGIVFVWVGASGFVKPQIHQVASAIPDPRAQAIAAATQ